MQNLKGYFYLIILFVSFQILTAVEIQTPLEKNRFGRLTSHAEMMDYLTALEKQADNFTISIIGESVQGRKIPALFFSADKQFAGNRENKPLVLIFCQQHGDEPSGKEAALMLARHLAGKGKVLLDKLDLILVPQVNPDGAEIAKRRNANKMDLNRNYVILSEPEAQALHDLFLKWKPQVTLDVHEYNAIKKRWIENGFVKDATEMMGGVTNLNIDRRLMDLSRSKIIPQVGTKIEQAGFSFHRYIVGDPFEGKRIRYSTTNINDGRQSMGIYNTLSFLIEGKRYGDVLNRIEYRVKGQLAAQIAFLEVIAKNAYDVIKLVNTSRQELLLKSKDKYVPIQMDYFPDPQQTTITFPVFDFSTWKREEKALTNFEPLVKIKKSIPKPWAYIFSQDEDKLIELLNKHQIKMLRLKKEAKIETETYTILHVTPAVDEDKPILNVDAEKNILRKTYKKGDVVVPLDQAASNLIPLLLEAQSTYSICQKRNGHQYRFEDFIKEGKTYPIGRIMKAVSVQME